MCGKFVKWEIPLAGNPQQKKIKKKTKTGTVKKTLERNILDILSLFQEPLRPGALRFYGIDPDNREVFRNLEKSLLLEIITYPGEENKEDIRLYVPAFVSRLVQKSLDNRLEIDFHLKAGRYFENYFPGEDASYIETIIEARGHFIAAG